MQPENSVQAMAMIKPRSEVDFENATVGDVMSGDVIKARFRGGVTNKAGGDQDWASHEADSVFRVVVVPGTVWTQRKL
jgi:hypothetical protein